MRQILISGANSQIGSYLAKEYYKEGYKLVLLYHKRKERISELFNKDGIFSCPVDLCNSEAVKEAVFRAEQFLHQSSDTLIHCAAIRSSDALPLYQTEPMQFANVLSTNMMSAYNILRWTLPSMQENAFGRVIMFGSDVSQKGLQNGSAYSASKAGIVNLVKSVALEMAKYNIVINAISPAPVETNLEEDYSGEYLNFRKRYFAEYLAQVPTGKLVTKEEIKKVTDLLIDENIKNLNGEEIIIDGGV
jgi:NAD(P)-dependent dehydrogenase (short-subunit alcohol dehydrogenase family)